MAANAFFSGTITDRSEIPFEQAYAVLGDDYVKAEFAIRCCKNGLVFGFPMAKKTIFFIAFIAFNNSHDLVKGHKWNIPVDSANLQGSFTDWGTFVQKLVSLVPADGSTRGWFIWEMPLAPTYVNDRVVMMGDAAHASTPLAGSGAVMAVEDWCVLHTVLGKYLDPERRAKNKFQQGYEHPTSAAIV
jgi:salicylate hydroxylase